MKLNKESFLDLMEHVCYKRPLLYTRNGTFWEAFAFIQGYALGADVHGLRGSHAGVQDFFHWLEKKGVGIDSKYNGFTLDSFRAMYPDDKAALAAFAQYYKEFCEQLPDEEDEIELKLTESEAHELANFLEEKKRNKNVTEKIKNALYINANTRDYLRSKVINQKD